MELFFRKISADHPFSKPAFIILHGLYSSSSNWYPIARTISELSHSDVYLPDLPNHGHSPWEAQFSYTHVAGQLVQWIRNHVDLFANGVILVGHSFGARVALVASIALPDLVRGVAMIDMSPFMNRKQDRAIAMCHSLLLQTILEAKKAGVEDIDSYIAQRSTGNNMAGMSLSQSYRQMNIGVVADNIMSLVDDYESILATADFSPMRHLPLLFIRGGEASPYMPDEAVAHLPTRFGNYRVVTLEDTTHKLHHEKPEEVAQEIARMNP